MSNVVFRYAPKRGARWPWDVDISLLPGRFSFDSTPGWIEFRFRKDVRVLPEHRNKVWAMSGRLQSAGVEHRILAKFLEA